MTQMSKEYAEAMFMLGAEKNMQKEYGEEMEKIQEIFLDNPDYLILLSSPSIPLKERLSVIEQAFSDTVLEDVVSFMQLLCKKSRIRSFDKCVTEYKKLLDMSEKISNAKVTSAIELNADEKKALSEKLEKLSGHTVIMDCLVDKTLIGGIIVEMDGKILDGSIRRSLSDIKDVISK